MEELQMNKNEATREWCELAEKIVAYPEDFGLNRIKVAALARKLAEEREGLNGERISEDVSSLLIHEGACAEVG